MPAPDTYWAADEDKQKVLKALDERLDKWFEYVKNSNLMQLWRQAHNASYAGMRAGGRIGKTGDNLEYSVMRVNHFGNLKQHILTMVTGQRQYFEAKATNADHKSQAQAIIATSLVETVMKDKDLEFISQQAVEFALSYGEGWCYKEWDFNAGDVTAEMPDGKPQKSGDIKYHVLHPIDVARDPTRLGPNHHDWYIIRTPANRYNVLADHGESEDDKMAILQAPARTESEESRPTLVDVQSMANVDSDEIWVYTFFHRKCSALPEGRTIRFISPNMVLEDGPLLYPEMPLYRMASQEVAGTSLGYSGTMDLLPLQQAMNAVVSTVVTNLANFGVQNLWAPENSKFSIEEIKGGLKLITGGSAKPETLDFISIKPEVIRFLDLLEKWLETLSGVNSVARGNPEASLKSGSALALVQSQAIQFVALIQKAYIRFLENVATGTVKDFQLFADEPYIIIITGKDKAQNMKEFTKDDISLISRIQIQVGNPLSGTIAGRVNMVEQMGNLGLIKTPEMYLQVVSTGRIEPATESSGAEMLLIKSENEQLAKGYEVHAILLEDHPAHMKEHMAVLASPSARQEPAVVKATSAHLAEHHKLWREAPPDLLMALGIKPPQPQQQGQPGQPGAAGPMNVAADLNNKQEQQGNIGPPNTQAGPQQASQPGQPPQGSDMPRPPAMPRNALTGQRAPPPTNGT